MEDKTQEQIDVEFGAIPKPADLNMVRVKTGTGDTGVMAADQAQKLGLEIHPLDLPPAQQAQQTMVEGIKPASYDQQQTQAQQIQPATAQVETQSMPQDPMKKIQDELNTAYATEAAAIAQSAMAGEKQAVNEAAYYKTMQTQMEDFTKERAERAQQLNKLTNEYQADIQKLSDEMAGVKFKDYWADKTTGQKIMAAIAVGLGGFGAGMTGGQNQALSIINTAMQNDLNKQKENIANLGKAKDVKTENYRILLERYRTENAADAAALTLMTQQAELKLKEIAANTMSQRVKSDASQMIAKLQQQRWQLAQTAAIEAAKYQAEQRKDLKPMTVHAFGQYATTKEGAAKVNEMASSFYQIETGIDKLNQMAEKGSRFDLTDRANAEVVMTTLTGALRIPITGPGAFTEKEQNMIREVIGDPTKLTGLPSVTKAKLKALKAYAKDQLLSVAESEGLDVSTFEGINADRKRGRKASKVNFREIQ